MSQENVEVVRRLYEQLAVAGAINEQALLSLTEAGVLDPDAVLDLSTAYPGGPVVSVEAMSESFDTQPWGRSIRLEPESVRAVGSDRVLVFIRLHAIGTGSGVEVEGRTVHLVTLRDNRVVRTQVYTDRSQALEAVGLRE
jgi:ketosteroid isomerase-like protein